MKSNSTHTWSRLRILGLFAAFIFGSALILSSCSSQSRFQAPNEISPRPVEVETTGTVTPKEEIVISNRRNSAESMAKPYVLLISIDGFRYDYIEKYGANNLLEIEKAGRRAEGLIPSYPTLTFPNHYTIVTGMLPTTHGLVDNNFYDPDIDEKYHLSNSDAVGDGKWYGGEPLWVAAERSNLLSASFFWVGSEAEINEFRPTRYYIYDGKLTNETRVARVLQWLALPESERPHMLTLYFSMVDDAGHTYGPDSDEVAKAVLEADKLIGILRRGIAATKLPVNTIVVSDHGMSYLDPIKTVDLTTTKIDFKKFQITGGGTMIHFHSENNSELNEAYSILKTINNIKVYWREEIPEHYALAPLHRIGNIVVMADNGYYLMTRRISNPNKPSGKLGTHGWDNAFQDMLGIFLAEGPNITKGKQLSPFQNIHIYPLIMKILGLQTSTAVDGKSAVLDSIYQN